METDKFTEINLKIAEVKKRILLAEGQKTANTAEWQKQNRINNETISTLKKEIKELTTKCGRLQNPLQRPLVTKEPAAENKNKRAPSAPVTNVAFMVGSANYPVGAKSADDAIFLTDLKITESRKQLDLLKHRYKCRKETFGKLVKQYRDLKANKEAKHQNLGERPPETLEEDSNRKLVCQLENEIHRTNVQWMEAEHIRKKYRSIEASLMNDAERFERSLRELEQSLNEQQQEINRLQQVHNEAVEMRDAAKLILQRQEQQAHVSQKTREKQALDFRKQVEFRKIELERIGRKLFIESKTVVRQDSIGSIGGDHDATSKLDEDLEPNVQLQSITSEMENLFKHLMEVTGATSPQEVLQRFSSQKESATRLNYLRNAAETEKANLEAKRERLTKKLEASKFSDVKESEVSQEVIERLKNEIGKFESELRKNEEAAAKTMTLVKCIKERLSEVVYRLQEVDEGSIELLQKNRVISLEELPNFLASEAEDSDFIEIVQTKLKRCQELLKLQQEEEGVPRVELPAGSMEEELFLNLEMPKSPSVPEGDKPQPMPMCYYNLLAGRAQRAAGTSSSSPEQAPAAAAAATEEENEVPSRNFLKRQSVLIVESKSRRKPFRPTPGAMGARRK